MHPIPARDLTAERLVALFTRTFAASEGPDEGAVIGRFVAALLTTPPEDLAIFAMGETAGETTDATAQPVAAAVFSRLRFGCDPRRAMILSPMAVAPDHQGVGIGQALLRHALTALSAAGEDLAVTYGDPAFYGKLGFAPVRPEDVPPPLPLSMPQGWIAQSLTDAPLAPLPGPCRCVPALNDPALW